MTHTINGVVRSQISSRLARFSHWSYPLSRCSLALQVHWSRNRTQHASHQAMEFQQLWWKIVIHCCSVLSWPSKAGHRQYASMCDFHLEILNRRWTLRQCRFLEWSLRCKYSMEGQNHWNSMFVGTTRRLVYKDYTYPWIIKLGITLWKTEPLNHKFFDEVLFSPVHKALVLKSVVCQFLQSYGSTKYQAKSIYTEAIHSKRRWYVLRHSQSFAYLKFSAVRGVTSARRVNSTRPAGRLSMVTSK